MNQLKIVILEDELIVVRDLKKKLTDLGYDVIANFDNGKDLIQFLKHTNCDLLLADIQLKGDLDGIETVKAIKNISKAPVIFITAQSDHATFNDAKNTKPAAYLVKPYNNFDLQTSIELTLENHLNTSDPDNSNYVIDEKIFVRGKNRFERIDLMDIQYLEASGNYTDIITEKNKYVVTAKLGQLEKQLQEVYFLRCHRSFMVNLKLVDGFDDSNVYINDKKIPISKNIKKEFLEKLRVI